MTLFFVSINFANGRTLSIVDEINQNGRKGFLVIMALGLILINLSPVPIAPVVYALYQNINEIMVLGNISTLLILLVFAIITLPLIYRIKSRDEYVINNQWILINLSAFLYVSVYLGLIFLISWEGVR